MKKKYKIQLIILYYTFATILGCSLAIAYKINPENINYIGVLIAIVLWTLVILIQRKIVKKSKADTI